MPFTEIILPQLNTSPEGIKTFNETWPALARQTLAARPSIDSQYQGWVLSEDGRDVQDEHKYLILLEWHAKSDFENFIASPEFKSMAGASMPFMAGPTTLQLFETKASPANSAKASLTAVLRTSIKGSENTAAAAKIWTDLAEKIGDEAEGLAHGPSVNLEEELYIGVLGWGSTEVMYKENVKSALEGALAELHGIGSTSLIMLKLDAIKKA